LEEIHYGDGEEGFEGKVRTIVGYLGDSNNEKIKNINIVQKNNIKI